LPDGAGANYLQAAAIMGMGGLSLLHKTGCRAVITPAIAAGNFISVAHGPASKGM